MSGVIYSQRYRHLRGRNQVDGGCVFIENGKEPRHKAVCHQHSTGGNGDDCQPLLVGDGFDPAFKFGIDRMMRGNSRSGKIRIFGIEDNDRKVIFNCRSQRSGVQHFSAKIGELCSFLKTHVANTMRGGDKRRICSEYTVHIRPDFNKFGIEHGAEQSRRIIRAAATQCCCAALFCAADKALNHRDDFVLQQRRDNCHCIGL